MPVVGYNFNSIQASADLSKPLNQEIQVNSTPSITNILKKPVSVKGVKEVLVIEFEFKTMYEPKIGSIELKGEILYQHDDIDNILKSWKDKKNLDENVLLDVMNTIMRRSLTKIVYLSDELRLPPPVRFPIVQKGKDK